MFTLLLTWLRFVARLPGRVRQPARQEDAMPIRPDDDLYRIPLPASALPGFQAIVEWARSQERGADIEVNSSVFTENPNANFICKAMTVYRATRGPAVK
ncbi:hypothetical protein pipiens_009705, partial [Culex pipiens pipiens]